MPHFRPRHTPLRANVHRIVVPAMPEDNTPIICVEPDNTEPPMGQRMCLPPILDGMIPTRQTFSAEDIGPVGDPTMPEWLQREAEIVAPVIQQPVMPSEFYEEAMYGIKVAPQDPDYIPPPVQNVVDPVGFSSTEVSDDTLVRMISDGVVKLGDKDIKDVNITSADFGSETLGPDGERLNLLDGVSPYQRFGSSSGRSFQ